MSTKLIKLEDNDGNQMIPQVTQRTYLQSSGTQTYTLIQGIYMLYVARWSASAPSQGVYFIQAHANTSCVVPLVTSGAATVDINSLTLTVTTTSNWVTLLLQPLYVSP